MSSTPPFRFGCLESLTPSSAPNGNTLRWCPDSVPSHLIRASAHRAAPSPLALPQWPDGLRVAVVIIRTLIECIVVVLIAVQSVVLCDAHEQLVAKLLQSLWLKVIERGHTPRRVQMVRVVRRGKAEQLGQGSALGRFFSPRNGKHLVQHPREMHHEGMKARWEGRGGEGSRAR
mmetsp:Transcript_35589/g.76013  ORF Transcript_35589/g.76013 Transcript_35589/m.76013 type:complete len:174 (+) Transcript_35589:112-633(+)